MQGCLVRDPEEKYVLRGCCAVVEPLYEENDTTWSNMCDWVLAMCSGPVFSSEPATTCG